MFTNWKAGTALVALACAAMMTGSVSAVTPEVAKKCAGMMVEAFPPREPGNPAAGSANGSIIDQRDFYDKCVANGGAAVGRGAPQTGAGNRFQAGQAVRFPSGGPKMKVVGTVGDDVLVQWTTESGQVVTGTIPAVALVSREDFGLESRPSGNVRPPRQTENRPYRPCPASVAFNGHNVCLGFPD